MRFAGFGIARPGSAVHAGSVDHHFIDQHMTVAPVTVNARVLPSLHARIVRTEAGGRMMLQVVSSRDGPKARSTVLSPGSGPVEIDGVLVEAVAAKPSRMVESQLRIKR